MCYDISFTVNIRALEDYFPDLVIDDQISMDFDLTVHVQAQSYRKYPVVVMDEGRYKLKMFEWGIIPNYMDTPEKIKKGRSFMCNARSEKIIGDKKSFWWRIRKNRCLIPMTGTYEHREIKGWKNKVPYFVRLKDRELFCIPGLYYYNEKNADVETGEIKGTYSLITRPANSVMQMIHNGGDNAFRMPLFLPKELELKWLDPNLTDEEMQSILDYEMPAEELDYWTTWTIRSTKPHPAEGKKNDHYDWPNLPPLGNDEGLTKENVLF